MGDPAAVTVRPQIFEAFPEPASVDEARARREALIREHAVIDGQMSVRHDLEWRAKARSDLRRIQAEIRMLKEYLRKNDVAKESEWKLLARAHAMLVRWVTADIAAEFPDLARREEAEALLDAIELVVPGQYLNKTREVE
jgi:hypothetical protein